MPAIVVIGGQWGDEGKGRTVDLLARRASIVARYSAGNNAGHTVINQLGEFHLHIVPAGIFYPDKVCVVGNGVAVDPGILLEEIEQLESQGVSTKNLFVSDRAHIIMPYHILIDRLDEELRAAMEEAAIGTTGRGVGPAFVDKVGRIGIRMSDLIDPEAFRRRLRYVLDYKNTALERLYQHPPLDFDEVYARYVEYGCRLVPYVRDTGELVREALTRGEVVLLEGAQGSLLDLDSGTYEFVTSSVPSSTAGGAAVGIGIGPTQISNVVGIYKAYTTRVGNGPLPTELKDETGDLLRRRGDDIRPGGGEYGTTTGRPRRCGWFDAVASRYSARVNGVTNAALTRLDVLDTFPTIKICTAYEVDGRRLETLPASTTLLGQAQPVYEEFPGWQTATADLRTFAALPPQAQAYVKRLQELLGVPIDLVSVGPERDQAIEIKPII